MNAEEDRANWKLFFWFGVTFIVLVVVFAWTHNGRESYAPLFP
jgi:hypothetical protein